MAPTLRAFFFIIFAVLIFAAITVSFYYFIGFVFEYPFRNYTEGTQKQLVLAGIILLILVVFVLYQQLINYLAVSAYNYSPYKNFNSVMIVILGIATAASLGYFTWFSKVNYTDLIKIEAVIVDLLAIFMIYSVISATANSHGRDRTDYRS